MGTRYSLSGLSGVWSEAVKRHEPTLAFELTNGRGRFLFMMFFDEGDESTKDDLLLFLQNIRSMLHIKLYGSHVRVQFDIFLNDTQIEQMKRELGLADHHALAFDVGRFIQTLNSGIPKTLPLVSKIQVLRENRAVLEPHLPDLVDDHLKTELVGILQLDPSKRPREKTLRKLYLYGGPPQKVAEEIERLKERNCTLRWRVPSR